MNNAIMNFISRSDMFHFVDYKTLYFTVHSTMHELYRMDCIFRDAG